MPITATLAMVACAAMAGVPLLNGFLSKEMFFAETIVTHAHTELDRALPYIATLASAFAVTSSPRLIHGVSFRPRPVDPPRTTTEPPTWMRFPVACRVLARLHVGLVQRPTVGLFHVSGVRTRLGPDTPR